VVGIDLSGKTMTGELPSWIGGLTALTSKLSLSTNDLNGPVPTELGRLTGLLADFQLGENRCGF
jgi:hypothetical protein